MCATTPPWELPLNRVKGLLRVKEPEEEKGVRGGFFGRLGIGMRPWREERVVYKEPPRRTFSRCSAIQCK